LRWVNSHVVVSVLSWLLSHKGYLPMANRKRSREAATATLEVDLAQLTQPPFNAKMALFGVQMMHANLAAARTVFDAWRTMVRTQQDAVLDALNTQVHEVVATDEGDEVAVGKKANGAALAVAHGALDAFA
jgi:hypothetical protein